MIGDCRIAGREERHITLYRTEKDIYTMLYLQRRDKAIFTTDFKRF